MTCSGFEPFTGQAGPHPIPPQCSALPAAPNLHPPGGFLPLLLLCPRPHPRGMRGSGDLVALPRSPSLLRQAGRTSPSSHPNGRTLLHKLQQLGLGRPRVSQHQQVDVSSASEPIREPRGGQAGGQGWNPRAGAQAGWQWPPTCHEPESRWGDRASALRPPAYLAVSLSNLPPREGRVQ